MTNQPPSNEAVEAAMKYCKAENDNDRWFILPFRIPHTNETPDEACSRILAAEVERLRAQADAVCEWKYDEYYRDHDGGEVGLTDWPYSSQCGETHTAEHGPHCPGCGRKVKITTNDNEQ